MLDANEAYRIFKNAFPKETSYKCVEFPKLYAFELYPSADDFGGECGIVYKSTRKAEVVGVWWFVNFADCGDEEQARIVPEAEYKHSVKEKAS